MTDLLSPTKPFKWNTVAQKALEEIKKEIKKPLKLSRPDSRLPFILQTDASAKGMGAVLLQEDTTGQLTEFPKPAQNSRPPKHEEWRTKNPNSLDGPSSWTNSALPSSTVQKKIINWPMHYPGHQHKTQKYRRNPTWTACCHQIGKTLKHLFKILARLSTPYKEENALMEDVSRSQQFNPLIASADPRAAGEPGDESLDMPTTLGSVTNFGEDFSRTTRTLAPTHLGGGAKNNCKYRIKNHFVSGPRKFLD